jgi:hypothetical protein
MAARALGQLLDPETERRSILATGRACPPIARETFAAAVSTGVVGERLLGY